MLLAIDAGNTNIVLGVFDGETLVQSWRLQTLRERTSDELGLLVDGLFAHSKIERVQVRGVILGSVVPPLTPTLRAMTQRYFGVTALSIEPGVETGMPILYENPAEVGADRIVNGVAAYEKFGRGAGRPLIVVDFGTATTLDAITAQGEYLGGAICPGVQISADALFQRAARLPRIDVRKPARIVGRTTVGAMESGLFYGYVGMVEGLVRRMTDELGGSAISVATGGLADMIAPETPVIQHVDPDLTLHGLRIVWQRNQPTTAGR
ncbi:MAG: type III pantothenate kinase [Acidobacteria bacterium]|nr:MAG: type III pantothenate kinase [Acidobacteriota bacterium]PYQ89402.1 MAG: type III pantothenate kinase [Acidobacteriota bacterium]PYR04717.1 MAG: type III pantothenate kinase [Acidobacteriota bacterium]